LIPRPETEQLTEAVLACEPLWKRASPALVDVGTGSGCIIISLALARPEAQYHAIDNDPAALELARSNARRHRVLRRIRFRAGDLLEMFAPASLDAVVSNPPYVRTGDWEQLPAQIRDYEPRAALDGGADGLAVIRPLISQAGRVLKPGGRLFLEIGAEQAKSVRSLLAANNFTDCAIRADLAGKHRIASARRPDGP
jgi:release factor glutamine methyltransferase